MPFVSITRLRIRAVRYMPEFLWLTFLSVRQVKRSAGHLRSRTLRDAERAFWTMSVWDSETSMRAYMLAGAHRRAMPKLLEWCDEAAVAHWTQDTDTLPDWREAHRRLLNIGRRSKINHPSPRHLSMTLPEPRV